MATTTAERARGRRPAAVRAGRLPVPRRPRTRALHRPGRQPAPARALVLGRSRRPAASGPDGRAGSPGRGAGLRLRARGGLGRAQPAGTPPAALEPHARRAGGAGLHPAGSPAARAQPRRRAHGRAGARACAISVRTSAGSRCAWRSPRLQRVFPLAYAADGISGSRRDMARVRGVGPADRDAIIAAITAVLGRDPTTVACGARRAGAAARRGRGQSWPSSWPAACRPSVRRSTGSSSEQRAALPEPRDFDVYGWCRRRAGRSSGTGGPAVRLDTARVCARPRPAPRLDGHAAGLGRVRAAQRRSRRPARRMRPIAPAGSPRVGACTAGPGQRGPHASCARLRRDAGASWPRSIR